VGDLLDYARLTDGRSGALFGIATGETQQMNTTHMKAVFFAGLTLLAAMAPRALADQWDQRTIFTFSGPVEIPGQVLGAGTYVFKLADSTSDRNIVQVFNKNEKHLYGTFLAIPDARLRPAGKPIITFDETPAGSPEAVRAWFYPGENYGHQFVYPKPKAVALAKANNIPVPSMPAELAVNTTKPAATLNEPPVMALKLASLKAQMPTEEELEIGEVFVAQAPPSDPSQLPAELPKTGSPVPLIGLLGLLSVATALSLRIARKDLQNANDSR
jgi:LPXTG-motif cell wall-anchored protein